MDDGGGRPAVEWVGGRRRGNAEEEEAEEEEEEEDDEIGEKGRVDLQLRRESQAVTDRQTNLTALSFSSFSLLRLHSRPASPMHRIAHIYVGVPPGLHPSCLPFTLYPVDLRPHLFLSLRLSFFSSSRTPFYPCASFSISLARRLLTS